MLTLPIIRRSQKRQFTWFPFFVKAYYKLLFTNRRQALRLQTFLRQVPSSLPSFVVLVFLLGVVCCGYTAHHGPWINVQQSCCCRCLCEESPHCRVGLLETLREILYGLDVFLAKMKLSINGIFFFQDNLTIWQVHRHCVSGSSSKVASCLVCTCRLWSGRWVWLCHLRRKTENIDKWESKKHMIGSLSKNDMNQWLVTSHDPIVETKLLLHLASIFWSINSLCFPFGDTF